MEEAARITPLNGKLFMTELPAEAAPNTVQTRIDAMLLPDVMATEASAAPEPAEETVVIVVEVVDNDTAHDDVMVKEEEAQEEEGARFVLPASWSARKLLVEEVARKSALQRRDSAVAKMHTRRAGNLLRQVAMRDLRLQPLTRLIREYKESLRKAVVAAASDTDRQPALANLQRLKQLIREAEGPCQRNDTRLERMAAMYDSDIDVMEGALSGGRIPAAAAAAAAASAADTPPLLSSQQQQQQQQQRGLSDSESGLGPAATTTTTTTTTKRRRTVAPSAGLGPGAKRRLTTTTAPSPAVAQPATPSASAAATTASASANPSQEDEDEEEEAAL